MIFDAGTGLRYLGNELARHGPVDTDVFLTHSHFDHICGVPFFVPLFIPANQIRIWAGHLGPAKLTVKKVLEDMMVTPLFSVAPEIFAADVSYNDFKAGDTLTPRPGVTLRTTELNHPDNATGYRIEFDGKSICYLTDTQHVIDQPDQKILDLVEGTDLMIYDSTYTDKEFPARSDWGHSTWEEGVRLANAANVRKFMVFHHDPDRTDAFMDRVVVDVEKARPGSIIAQEGMILRP
jgi:phosphoribosyl 1,2-cyclic phosphodiesterase